MLHILCQTLEDVYRLYIDRRSCMPIHFTVHTRVSLLEYWGLAFTFGIFNGKVSLLREGRVEERFMDSRRRPEAHVLHSGTGPWQLAWLA